LQLTRQVLTRDEALDHSGDTPLFLNVDEGFELHQRREGSESSKNLWMRRRFKGIGFGINANRLVWCGWIYQIRQLTMTIQLGEVLT
jgi:hypothetical protein